MERNGGARFTHRGRAVAGVAAQPTWSDVDADTAPIKSARAQRLSSARWASVGAAPLKASAFNSKPPLDSNRTA